ncbi:MAG TPA: hypothetical protein VKZ79_07165 [Alphaproteobacteria bacterium]|nr:hypothetical protein [Alphaproteobacteria bacterium]
MTTFLRSGFPALRPVADPDDRAEMGELRVIRSGIFALAVIVAWHVSAQRPEFYGQWLVERIATKHDVSKRPIGILEVVLPYRPADDRSALLETAASISRAMTGTRFERGAR